MNSQIAAADEQSSVVEEINQSIVTINRISEENVDVANEISKASHDLAVLANELKTAVNLFTVKYEVNLQ